MKPRKGANGPKNRKFWRRLLVGGAAVVILAGVGALVTWERIRPMNHFQVASLPVLADPQQGASAPDPLASASSSNTDTSSSNVSASSTGGSGNPSSQNARGQNGSGATGNGQGSGTGSGSGSTGMVSGAKSGAKSGANVSRPVVRHTGQFNVLLLGNDARTAGAPSHTDSILIIHVDLVAHQYHVISIPRDTRVDLPGYGWTKITHASFMGDLHGGLSVGTKDAIQAISNLTGLEINYYAETNYWGLKDIVDTVGGIDMYVPFKVTLTHPWYGNEGGMVIQPGMHQVNGEEVANLTHERYSLKNGDFGRQQLQEEALIGIARKLSQPENLTRLPKVIRTLSKFLVATNMTRSDMLSLAVALRHFHANQIHYYQVPGHSIYAKDPIMGIQLYYWVPNLTKLHEIIRQHFLDS